MQGEGCLFIHYRKQNAYPCTLCHTSSVLPRADHKCWVNYCCCKEGLATERVIAGIQNLFTVILEKRSILVLHVSLRVVDVFLCWLIFFRLGKQKVWSTNVARKNALALASLNRNHNLFSTDMYISLSCGELRSSERFLLVWYWFGEDQCTCFSTKLCKESVLLPCGELFSDSRIRFYFILCAVQSWHLSSGTTTPKDYVLGP